VVAAGGKRSVAATKASAVPDLTEAPAGYRQVLVPCAPVHFAKGQPVRMVPSHVVHLVPLTPKAKGETTACDDSMLEDETVNTSTVAHKAVRDYAAHSASRTVDNHLGWIDSMCTHTLVTQLVAKLYGVQRRKEMAVFTVANGQKLVCNEFVTLRVPVTLTNGRQHAVFLPAFVMPEDAPGVDSLISAIELRRLHGTAVIRDIKGTMWEVQLVKRTDRSQPSVPYIAAIDLGTPSVAFPVRENAPTTD
jgi:hypothetical protein